MTKVMVIDKDGKKLKTETCRNKYEVSQKFWNNLNDFCNKNGYTKEVLTTSFDSFGCVAWANEDGDLLTFKEVV